MVRKIKSQIASPGWQSSGWTCSIMWSPPPAQNRPLLPDLCFVPTSFYFQIIAILFAAMPCTFAFSSVMRRMPPVVFFCILHCGSFRGIPVLQMLYLVIFFHIVDIWWSESGKKRYMVDLRGFVIVGISFQTKTPRRILGAIILL